MEQLINMRYFTDRAAWPAYEFNDGELTVTQTDSQGRLRARIAFDFTALDFSDGIVLFFCKVIMVVTNTVSLFKYIARILLMSHLPVITETERVQKLITSNDGVIIVTAEKFAVEDN